MKNILTSTSKIRFQDCDPFNHLNNAKYLDYMLNAREYQLMQDYDFDIFKIAATQHIGWVIASNQIHYFLPALVMENIVIDSQLINYSSKSLLVEMRMWNDDQTKLKAVLWTNFIHFDLKLQRPINHSPAFSALFGNILLPVEQTTFDDRRNNILRSIKVPLKATV